MRHPQRHADVSSLRSRVAAPRSGIGSAIILEYSSILSVARVGATVGRRSSSDPVRLVFIHGIGPARDVEKTRTEWIEALARGAGRAGHRQLASHLADSSEFEVVFAYYGDLFTDPGAQGGGGEPEDDEGSAFLHAYLLEVVEERLAELDPADPEAEQWRRAREELLGEGVAQGPGSVGRQVLNVAGAVMSFGPLSRPGQWAGRKLLVRDLSQVGRYLRRREPGADGRTLDERIRARIHAAIDDRPAVVIAHSLGSVVAVESLHDAGPAASVPLLVTVGSPLAMRTVVWPHVRPRPPRTPDRVARWLNFWDRDDVIAARPRLEDFFGGNATGVRPMTDRVDSDGLWTHTATKYLEQPAIAGPVAEALAGPATG